MLAVAEVCPLSSVFLIVISTYGHAKFPHGSEIWRNADLHRLGCLSEQHHACPFRQRWTMGNILFTLSYRQCYCSACEQPADLVFLYRRHYFKPAILVQAERYIWWSQRIFRLQMWNTMAWSAHTHAHTPDCSLWYGNHTDSTTEASISFYILCTKWKGEMIRDGIMPSLWICMFSFPLRLWQGPIFAVHADDRERVLDLV